jgi:hypothetical protein
VSIGGPATVQYLPPKYFYDQSRGEYQVHCEVIDEWGQSTIKVFHYRNGPPPPPHYFLPKGYSYPGYVYNQPPPVLNQPPYPPIMTNNPNVPGGLMATNPGPGGIMATNQPPPGPGIMATNPPPPGPGGMMPNPSAPDISTAMPLDQRRHMVIPNGPHGVIPNGPHGVIPNGPHGIIPNGPHGVIPNGPTGTINPVVPDVATTNSSDKDQKIGKEESPELMSIKPKPEPNTTSTNPVPRPNLPPGPIPMYPAPPSYVLISPVPLNNPNFVPVYNNNVHGSRSPLARSVHIPSSVPPNITTIPSPIGNNNLSLSGNNNLSLSGNNNIKPKEPHLVSVIEGSDVIEKSGIETTVVPISTEEKYPVLKTVNPQEKIEPVVKTPSPENISKSQEIQRYSETDQQQKEREQLVNSQYIPTQSKSNKEDSLYVGISKPYAPPKTKVKSFDAHDDL